MFAQIILTLTNELKRLQGVINTLQKNLRPVSTTITPTITFSAETINRVQAFIDSSELPGNFLEKSDGLIPMCNDRACPTQADQLAVTFEDDCNKSAGENKSDLVDHSANFWAILNNDECTFFSV